MRPPPAAITLSSPSCARLTGGGTGVAEVGPCLASARRRRHTAWIIPLGLTASYALFALAVHLRLLDGLDVAVGHAARPGGVWGPVQARAARVVSALQPTHLALPLLLLAAATSLRRRSLRPSGVMVVVGGPVVIVTLASKRVMAYWDPSTKPVSHAGFPSGHTVTAVIAFGVVVLLLRPDTRWGWLVPGAVGCVTGTALVLASVHPVTDVLGAGLLATAALTGAAAATSSRWASDPRRKNLR